MFNSNASSADAGGADYIEDVFSTWLYDGNGATQTITNGIDIAGEGGLVWLKNRTSASVHGLFDTARGNRYMLQTNGTDPQDTNPVDRGITSFNSNGFSLGPTSFGSTNDNTKAYVSWTFRKQPKFFDVVTYTGDGVAGREIAHNLGSVPGMIIVKEYAGTSASTANWVVYHRSLGNTQFAYLNSTNAAGTAAFWNNTNPTATNFTIGSFGQVNETGGSFVAYLFAHDAGGFGLTGTDNVISCGSFTTDGSGNATVSLGYEPQWILVKTSGVSGSWRLIDTMRGWSMSANDAFLNADSSAAESNDAFGNPTATGFLFGPVSASTTYIYIAIRRGPMKVPTDGTEVFVPVTSSATGSVLTSNFPVDMGLIAGRGVYERGINDRLRGFANADSGSWPWLVTQTTAAEALQTPSLYNANNTSIQTGAYFGSASAVSYLFGRAPGFFDEVCYTGTGANGQTYAHNLAAVPELMIVKSRSQAVNWAVYTSTTTATSCLLLDDPGAPIVSSTIWNNTAPTASVFTLGTTSLVNTSAATYVAYLFATCPGVSKVGSYTGTGTTQVVNCGFTAGSRFVLIKRTDSTGDWYVWDSARGIVAGNDPYLLLNSTAAEVTSTDYVDTAATGFELTATAPAAINASGGNYIFLAIA